MTVDVSLCGSIPRSEMISFHSSHCWPRLEGTADQPVRASKDQLVAMAASSFTRKVSDDQVVSSTHAIEPPSWAVPAKGEAILEPISDTCLLHKPVDLTKQAIFRIGRSELSDMQLLHCTSSRRHAILFHHPNGSCYVVDCGSAHGTFVNGIRVRSSVTENGVVPQKVKKGALIRFGGPGAPSFILKSFAISMDSLVKTLHESQEKICNSNFILDESPDSPCRDTLSVSALDALVTLNTRLNSVAYTPFVRPFKCSNTLLDTELCAHDSHASKQSFLKRRHTVSFDDDAHDESLQKKMKSVDSIESTSSVDSDDSSIPIVSPSYRKPVLQFQFHQDDDRPVVSPNPFDDSTRTLPLGKGVITSILNATLSIPPASKKKSKSVNFCVGPPDVFYAPVLYPETGTEEHCL